MLKQFFSLLIALCMLTNVTAQVPALPGNVQNNFASKYTAAVIISWKKTFGTYQVTCREGMTMMNATFSEEGDWQKTDTKLMYKDLPAPVADSFKVTRYRAIPVKDVIKTENKKKPLQYTIITMKGAVNKTSIVFDEYGHLLSEKNFL